MIFSKIVGIGSYLPENFLTNDELSKTVDTSDEWITTRTGIKKRHIAPEQQYTSDLATEALKNALTHVELTPNYLDAIIVATTTPDRIFPATAVRVQNNIGMRGGFAFDIQAVCAGFIYALQVADSLLKAQQVKRIAVIGADVMSRIVDWKDRNTCVLFGDGAGCVILEQREGEKNDGILDIKLYSDGQYEEFLMVDGGVSRKNKESKIRMAGSEVFRHAVIKMSDSIKSIVEKNKLSIHDLDWLLLHQANYRIIKAVAEKLEINMDKAISMVSEHANTSAASIPLALDCYVKDAKVKTGDLIALSAIGGGLAWGSALIRL
ncbi:beta-ketoacyl-ACP synthase III [Candidatus Bandiella euplotis]|uniref:Beta-ketoacyl-[acyl-carrier-protein] synthase III n=1 Tax=Candidatus Bandiella euplotis TaxID=1664265 RepID=A0ABZ0UMJ5_9RICK|nr:beta-ketoacyl-ACP synthase III [Candidatus Bandiella woodruffii]WPX96737.1 3-oxoacyl-[acyl-carrier-protein] synthase 3 [Candidatus Bandiella woodruffii]